MKDEAKAGKTNGMMSAVAIYVDIGYNGKDVTVLLLDAHPNRDINTILYLQVLGVWFLTSIQPLWTVICC